MCSVSQMKFYLRVINRMQTQSLTTSKQTHKVLSTVCTRIFALISGHSSSTSKLSFNEIILLCVPHTLCPNLHLRTQQRGKGHYHLRGGQ